MDRVAVLGFGSSGHRFVSLVRKRLPKAEILVFSSQQLSGEAFRSTSKLSDVTKFGPTIAIICGVASERLQMVEALESEVRGVLVEKPLAVGHPEGLQVARELEKRGSITQVGYNLRFSTSLRHFKDTINGLSMGRVLSLRAETGQFLPSWRTGRDYRTSASARQASGGGVLLELSHEIDYLRWIFGDIEWVSAWSGRQSDLDIDVEDTAHLTLGFSSGDSFQPLVGQVNLDFIRHDRTRSITAVCANGTLRWDGIALRVEQWTPDNPRWDVLFAEDLTGPTTYEMQWDSFYSAASHGTAPVVSVEDGAAVLSVIDAARSSQDSQGRRVSLLAGGCVS